MDYQYETLGPERFQEFCATLITKEFPNTQSYPVAQPDGGRDALAYYVGSPKKEFIIFQVKFVRNPSQIPDVHKWLTQILNDEAVKVNKLIPKGAKTYYLLTNVKGTGHLEVGSIDMVTTILQQKISIPAICWWRDDLSRMFEKDPIFKWSFPQILNGQDILNSALFNNLNENKERREAVIRSYLVDQYKLDDEVKFKQIDLQNRLLDLFTDIPIRIKKINEKNRDLKKILAALQIAARKLAPKDDLLVLEEADITAANFLLHPQVQNGIQKILLEGGPGQGKSTISQYISQVHRARLLRKRSDISLLPDNIKNSPIRIPFKMDLRHIAAWVENKNPYQGVISDEYFGKIWQKSLESFLIGHIFYHSKIDNFTTNDFIAISNLSAILFVFDGFDEIANLEVRKEVIEFINKGISRISENSKSIQVIITSRPSVFSDSIGFSVDSYPHFELTEITPPITKNYVANWIKANGLDSKEAAEIKRLVDEKLGMPHLRDLAKSPMQLAIFISLLRKKGESLPNKRTALYDSYTDLFFDRESEKSSTVRDHRDLIIDIHQYLAWVLHSEAEMLKNSGIIYIDDLKTKLKEYLTTEGHDTSIADRLFDVVKDRVCALASRVQGTFEFEVQPLREYFCAKYLYKTSPYSPLGSEKPGTLPDRFEAISRNFYWQNVVRFFAGCFSKGELSMLIQEIKKLQDDPVLKYTNYPRTITSQLLADYVFTQYPILLKDVVKIIVDGLNTGNITNQDYRKSNTDPILLPVECGRKEIVLECFKQLKDFPPNDYSLELIELIKNNPFETEELWLSHLQNISGDKLTTWIEYGYRLQILHRLDFATIISLLTEAGPQLYARLQILIDGSQFENLEKDARLRSVMYQGILEGQIRIHLKRMYDHTSLTFLSNILNPNIFSQLIEFDYVNATLLGFLTSRILRSTKMRSRRSLTDFDIDDEMDKSIKKFLDSIQVLLNSELSHWHNSVANWDFFLESARNVFGDRWSFYLIANIAAGIKSREETFDEFDELLNKNISLCKRARCARMKSGNVLFWERQLASEKDQEFVLLLLLTWATPKVLSQLSVKIAAKVGLLNSDQLSKLIGGLKKSIRASCFGSVQQAQIDEILKKKISDLFKYLVGLRYPEGKQEAFMYKNIPNLQVPGVESLDLKFHILINRYFSNSADESVLFELKKVYRQMQRPNKRNRYYVRPYQEMGSIQIPLDTARKIMLDSKNYPRIIASLAEKACRLKAYENIKPVGLTAKKEKWFSH